MTHTPVDVFLQWLGNRPRDCRMAIAVDGDSLLTDAGVLGKPNIADTVGRAWYPVVFRGNGLAFRMRFRSVPYRSAVGEDKHKIMEFSNGGTPEILDGRLGNFF